MEASFNAPFVGSIFSIACLCAFVKQSPLSFLWVSHLSCVDVIRVTCSDPASMKNIHPSLFKFSNPLMIVELS